MQNDTQHYSTQLKETSLPACSFYEPLPGSKRCKRYMLNGGCTDSNIMTCVKWMKLKAQKQAEEKRNYQDKQQQYSNNEKSKKNLPRDLFGELIPEDPKPKQKCKIKAVKQVLEPKKAKLPELQDVPIVRNLTDEYVASFKALCVEVCIHSKHVGPIWIVPEYTDAKRLEMSIEDAATLSAIMAIFPGATVTTFKTKRHKPNNECSTTETEETKEN